MRSVLIALALFGAGCSMSPPADPTGLEPYQRYLGAMELARENDAVDVLELIGLLGDVDPLARDGAVVAMGHTGRAELTPHLVEMTYEKVETADPKVLRMLRADACRALARLRDPRAVPALISAMRGDTAVEVRRTAALALEAFPERREALEALVEATADREAAVAWNACVALSHIAERPVVLRDTAVWREWLKRRP